VLRLARPTPPDNARRALFGWLTDKPVEKWAPATEADLPEEVMALAAFRKAETAETQVLIIGDMHARWDLLADTAKGPAVWAAIARKMGPQALRMNLNTLLRHGVFGPMAQTGWTVGRAIAEVLGFSPAPVKDNMVDYVAARLADADEIRRSRQFPYQFLAAYLNASDEVPQKIKAALHKAAEIACGNVPELPGPVVIGLDVSGSMASAVTGRRGRGATSKMRCVDVAALFAAAILRRNPDSVVIPFDTAAYEAKVDPSDSVLSLAERLAKFGGGGTNCSLPLAAANARYAGRGGSTAVVTEWQEFVKNQMRLGGHGIPSPKLICIDLQPYTTTQAPDRSDILNVGGFSDAVFSVVAAFMADDVGRFVAEVDAVEL
jgi:60 kDa SS-A/Ro ribonucleoprotein